MSIQIHLITHGNIGKALLQSLDKVLGHLPLRATAHSITETRNIQKIVAHLKKDIERNNTTDGILILTDLYGATPCNLAKQIRLNCPVHIISGVNMPMLIRIMNYAHLDLDTLAEKALTGGKDGVVNCAQMECGRTPHAS